MKALGSNLYSLSCQYSSNFDLNWFMFSACITAFDSAFHSLTALNASGHLGLKILNL